MGKKSRQKTAQAAASVDSPGVSEDKKNLSHELFAHEYFKWKNATKAYRLAYPEASYATARNNGSKLLANTYIQEIIEGLKQEQIASLKITKDDLLSIFAEVAKTSRDPEIRMKAADALFEKLGLGNDTAYTGIGSAIIKRVLGKAGAAQ